MFCLCFVIVDNDEVLKLIILKLFDFIELNNNFYSYLMVKGKKEIEIENLFKIEFYLNKVDEEFGIDFKNIKFSKDNSKWSIVLKSVLEVQGKVVIDFILIIFKKYIIV